MVMDPTAKGGDRGDKGAGPSLQPPGSQPSATEQLTSSIEEGKQYSGADVKTLVLDILSADGRDQKDRADKAEGEVTRLTGELGGVTTQVNTLTTQMEAITKAANDAELAKYSEDKPAQDQLRVRQANAAEAIRLTGVDAGYKARDVKLVERETAVVQKETSVSIKLAAMAAGVDETKLAEIVPDGDPARLANAATLIKHGSTPAPEIDPATGKPVIDPATGKPKPAALTQTPASLISAAGDSRSVSEKMLEDAKKK